ncbi:MAG: PLP-dependent aminotransferase family protein [Butyrivibrio sp.]|uniref:MocR-like pyridoxine biosynthesis transcription factor PdxR n=1 Tax=Butyrivibrio sp. TaxID=28121 RepID=UPI0025FA7623|nr:PLP-dependent aminotransferase family protein [Butyrivibrio sp.]MCR5771659.1 PLP-dependent aminotransferase family protein [Butyrivibrio sp.]
MYDVEKRGNRPIYEYLYMCIRDDIVSGRIKKGEKLLSKRRLAQQEGVALITVENAYEQLLVEGYIESRERSGYYAVMDAGSLSGSLHLSKDVRSNIVRTKRKTITSVSNKNKKDITDFVSQRLHDDAFPFDIWSKLIRKVLSDRNPECLAPPDPCGLEVLRSAIAGYLMRSRGIEADPDNIIIGPGTEYLENILLILSGGGALTAVEDPGYKKMGLLCERAGHKCLHIPVDKDGLIVSSLEGTSVRLLNISPSHHFPTGAVMSAGRRAQLLDWAEREGAYIAEDDYDSEFRFSGRPIPPISAAYPDKVIYMNTFTRTLAPSIRIAFMILPNRLMDLYRQKLDFYSGTVSSIDQLVMAEFINGGYYERHLSRMRNFYGKRRENIMNLFASNKEKQLFTPVKDTAGLRIVLKAPEWLDDEKFIKMLLENGIRMNCMNDYCYSHNSKYEHLFLASFGAADESDFKKALPVMEKVAGKCRR